MCGITGVVSFDGRKVDRQVLERATNKLKHRGPDAGGFYVDNESQPCVGLGHRRLSIIDLSASANQPMTNENKDVWVVFNGEIYNFLKLRDQLKNNHNFTTRSDTEVIVHLYEQYGDDAIAMLDGMFSIAIYDRKQHKVILARDRAGKKPLYYCSRGKSLIFASEIKALLPLLSSGDINLNEQVIPSYLVYGYAQPPQTFYRGILQLEPAHYAVYDRTGNGKNIQYWSLKNHILNNSQVGTPYAKDDPFLRTKLAGAVEKRLVSDVPLGAFLSGGIDSSIVTGLMSRFTQTPVKTFSIGFSEDARYDETSYANIVAKRYATDHHVFTVTPSTIELIDKIIYHYDEPFGDASAIPTYIVSNLTRQHVTVALNGDGGDELFAGYTRFVAAIVSERLPLFARTMLSGLSELFPAPRSDKNLLARAKRFLSVLNKPVIRRYLDWISYLPLHAVGDYVNADLFTVRDRDGLKDDILSHVTGHLKDMEGTSLLTQLLYLNFMTYLPYDLLVKMDRTTMANSLEARSPFLDTDLIEYVFTIPDDLKLNGFRTKYDLKYTFRDILPKQLMHRGKMGFGIPLGAWFRGKLKGYLKEQILSDDSLINTYLNANAVKHMFDEHQLGVRDHGLKLWMILTLELWLKNFKKGLA